MFKQLVSLLRNGSLYCFCLLAGLYETITIIAKTSYWSTRC